MLMKRFQVVRTVVTAVAVLGLTTSAMCAGRSAVLTQDEMARVWGSQSGTCSWAISSKPCTISYNCAGSSPRCDLGNCTTACSGAGNDQDCITGTAYQSCVGGEVAGGCGVFVTGLTCSFINYPNPGCTCVGNAVPTKSPCQRYTATPGKGCGAGG